MRIQSYRDLNVWQRSVDLVVEIYRLSKAFPDDERFGITAQIRRAAVSISSNIAEGSARTTTPDLLSFLTHSRGSLRETESLLYVTERLGFLPARATRNALDLTTEVGKMLTSLRRSLRPSP